MRSTAVTLETCFENSNQGCTRIVFKALPGFQLQYDPKFAQISQGVIISQLKHFKLYLCLLFLLVLYLYHFR